jgi:hypothetical protein
MASMHPALPNFSPRLWVFIKIVEIGNWVGAVVLGAPGRCRRCRTGCGGRPGYGPCTVRLYALTLTRTVVALLLIHRCRGAARRIRGRRNSVYRATAVFLSTGYGDRSWTNPKGRGQVAVTSTRPAFMGQGVRIIVVHISRLATESLQMMSPYIKLLPAKSAVPINQQATLRSRSAPDAVLLLARVSVLVSCMWWSINRKINPRTPSLNLSEAPCPCPIHVRAGVSHSRLFPSPLTHAVGIGKTSR